MKARKNFQKEKLNSNKRKMLQKIKGCNFFLEKSEMELDSSFDNYWHSFNCDDRDLIYSYFPNNLFLRSSAFIQSA
jgi:hypothetical protein